MFSSTFCNILPSTSHWFWTWNFLQMIMYYRNPCSVLISMTLNHILWLINILHLFIHMSNQLHLFPWKLSFRIVPFLKTPKSIRIVVQFLVVELTCALQAFPLFSKLIYLTSDYEMGFLKALHIPRHFWNCLLFVFQ
jgi:hypothetical protein